MRPSRNVRLYLEDMLEAVKKAGRFVQNITFAEFAANDEKIFAVVRALEIIGEASKKLPAPVRARCPEIPWRAVGGMRDKLMHEYFGVDLKRVWDTVRTDLPVLESALQKLLTELDKA